ncbi:hypothetical protein VTJ49DRAFT_719 [Mycothermus thermophilus]|uniref:Uncharacterized protein n=1 Tax=Humicola insolens TaxID=85995 RepID=A0ABR3VE98_HUMIN
MALKSAEQEHEIQERALRLTRSLVVPNVKRHLCDINKHIFPALRTKPADQECTWTEAQEGELRGWYARQMIGLLKSEEIDITEIRTNRADDQIHEAAMCVVKGELPCNWEFDKDFAEGMLESWDRGQVTAEGLKLPGVIDGRKLLELNLAMARGRLRACRKLKLDGEEPIFQILAIYIDPELVSKTRKELFSGMLALQYLKNPRIGTLVYTVPSDMDFFVRHRFTVVERLRGDFHNCVMMFRKPGSLKKAERHAALDAVDLLPLPNLAVQNPQRNEQGALPPPPPRRFCLVPPSPSPPPPPPPPSRHPARPPRPPHPNERPGFHRRRTAPATLPATAERAQRPSARAENVTIPLPSAENVHLTEILAMALLRPRLRRPFLMKLLALQLAAEITVLIVTLETSILRVTLVRRQTRPLHMSTAIATIQVLLSTCPPAGAERNPLGGRGKSGEGPLAVALPWTADSSLFIFSDVFTFAREHGKVFFLVFEQELARKHPTLKQPNSDANHARSNEQATHLMPARDATPERHAAQDMHVARPVVEDGKLSVQGTGRNPPPMANGTDKSQGMAKKRKRGFTIGDEETLEEEAHQTQQAQPEPAPAGGASILQNGYSMSPEQTDHEGENWEDEVMMWRQAGSFEGANGLGSVGGSSRTVYKHKKKARYKKKQRVRTW